MHNNTNQKNIVLYRLIKKTKNSDPKLGMCLVLASVLPESVAGRNAASETASSVESGKGKKAGVWKEQGRGTALNGAGRTAERGRQGRDSWGGMRRLKPQFLSQTLGANPHLGEKQLCRILGLHQRYPHPLQPFLRSTPIPFLWVL